MISLSHSDDCLDCCQELNTNHYTHSILFDVVIETKSCGCTFAKLIALESENSGTRQEKIRRKVNKNKAAYFVKRIQNSFIKRMKR